MEEKNQVQIDNMTKICSKLYTSIVRRILPASLKSSLITSCIL